MRLYERAVGALVPVQALTESDAVADVEIALASRWIICSMKL